MDSTRAIGTRSLAMRTSANGIESRRITTSRMAGYLILSSASILAACGEGGPADTGSDRVSTEQQAPSVVKAAVPGAADAVSPIFRFAKRSNGAYFYTGDPAERDTILATFPDFRYEGVSFQRNAGQTASVPVYRFGNLATGGYFYTASEEERALVLRDYPQMRFEGSSFSVTPLGTPDSAIAYRLANVNNGHYLFTASESERNAAVALGFWRDEGPVFSVPLGNGLAPNLDPRYRTPVWLAGTYSNNVYIIDPDRPNDTALRRTLSNNDDIIYVVTHRVDAATRKAWDPHVSNVLVRNGDTFEQLDLVKGRGELGWKQVSNERAASNTCSKSGVAGNRLFVDLANARNSTYVYLRRTTSGDCRLHLIRIGMSATDAPVLLPDVVPVSGLYDDKGALSGYLVSRAGELLRYDRAFDNPATVGSFGWNPSRIENLSQAMSVLPVSQISGDPVFQSPFSGNSYPGTGGWIGPTGRSFVLLAAYQSSLNSAPNRLFAYDDASRTIVQISQPGSPANFIGSSSSEEFRQTVAFDGDHAYWVGGGGVWRYSLRFNAAPQLVVADSDARPPVLSTSTHLVYHRALGNNPSALVYSVPKAGGGVIKLAEADTAGGRVRAVAVAGQTVYFNGSRDTNDSSAPRIFSGRVRANGSGDYDASLHSFWIGWVQPYAWGGSDYEAARLIRAEAAPNTLPSTQISMRLVSVEAANPASLFPLTTWTMTTTDLRFLGSDTVRTYQLPVFAPRTLISGDFQNQLGSLLDLYLADVNNAGTFVRKTQRGEVVQ